MQKVATQNARISGAEAVVRCLQAEGVNVVFGYPGGAILPLYDALHSADIRHILCRHEQGAVHAADGYARATGKVGVCIATSGPGATNLITGIANAYMDSIPVVAITGQVPVNLLGSDAFQEADLTGITMPITKHNYLVKDVADVPRILKEAFHIARTGRPGPVLIDLPKDVLTDRVAFDYPEKVDIPGYRPNLNGHPTQIAKAAAAINQAEQPVLFAGGGAISSGAAPLIRELAEKANLPVVTSLMGLGVLPADHPSSLGMVGMHGRVAANRAVNEADLLIALGVRFAERVTGPTRSFARKARIIHVDIDPAEIGKNVEVHIPIVGDLPRILQELLPGVRSASHGPWWEKILGWRDAYPLPAGDPGPDGAGPLRPQYVLRQLNARLGEEAIITTDVGQHQMWTALYYQFRRPRSLLSSSGLGTMGYGLPASLGAQVGLPDRTVCLISGDGSFQMTQQELATLVEAQAPVKIILLDNGYLGLVRQLQEFFYQNRYTAVRFQHNPDFILLAQAYGVSALRVTTPAEVGPALDRALTSPGPWLLDFVIEEEANVFPMIPPGEPAEKVILGPE